MELYPERKGNGGFQQVTLVRDLVEVEYAAHNAVEDTKALLQLFQHLKRRAGPGLLPKHTLTVQSVAEKNDYKSLKINNRRSLNPLIRGKLLSKGMAERAAASGLKFKHLKKAAQESPDGIKQLFGAPGADRKTPRVTRDEPICKKLQEYFDSNEN